MFVMQKTYVYIHGCNILIMYMYVKYETKARIPYYASNTTPEAYEMKSDQQTKLVLAYVTLSEILCRLIKIHVLTLVGTWPRLKRGMAANEA